jgi:hypothetical protein
MLKDFLGTWKYSYASADKYYRIIPVSDHSEVSVAGFSYEITWGNSEAALGSESRKNLVSVAEAARRIKSMSKGGFTLIKPYDGVLPASAMVPVDTQLPPKSKPKPKPKPEKFNFLNWLAERKNT